MLLKKVFPVWWFLPLLSCSIFLFLGKKWGTTYHNQLFVLFERKI